MNAHASESPFALSPYAGERAGERGERLSDIERRSTARASCLPPFHQPLRGYLPSPWERESAVTHATSPQMHVRLFKTLSRRAGRGSAPGEPCPEARRRG